MDILKMLMEQLTGSSVSKELDVSQDEFQGAAGIALPEILNALKNNASTPSGADSLSKALDDHLDDPMSLDALFKGLNQQDSSKMLDHILGSNKPEVEAQISEKTGLPRAKTSTLLMILAPLVLSMLSKKKKADNLQPADLPDLTKSLSKQSGGLLDLASQFLDKNKDGSIIDDLLGKLF